MANRSSDFNKLCGINVDNFLNCAYWLYDLDAFFILLQSYYYNIKRN